MLAAPSALAVVIVTGTGAGNTDSPPFADGWQHVGERGGGSAVYLGNRWVISAHHVGAGSVTLPSGHYLMEPDSAVRLENPPAWEISRFTDLAMFRLEEDPGLAPLTISSSVPAVGDPVTMIGQGFHRADQPTAWRIQPTANQWIWTETAWPGVVRGYKVAAPLEMRWGNNEIADDGEPDADHVTVVEIENGDVISLTTRFDDPLDSSFPITHEAQAVEGDSGGAVFAYRDGQWELAGIMHGTQPLPDQPAATAVFGDLTFIADLSKYRDQIEAILNAPDPVETSWQNAANPLDVNNDTFVSPIDALQVINDLNRNGSRELPEPPLPSDLPPPFVDVNGDTFVSPIDALTVINELNRRSSGSANAVPEPHAPVLAAIAALWLVVARRYRRRCRHAS